ncbi:MAG: ECF-type sigma factor [Planctomycetota bacterium]
MGRPRRPARQKAQKRPDEGRRVTLIDDAAEGEAQALVEVDLLDHDQALSRLGKIKPRYLQHIELRFFGGLSFTETAAVLGISRTSAVREWARARAWLSQSLSGEGA